MIGERSYLVLAWTRRTTWSWWLDPCHAPSPIRLPCRVDVSEKGRGRGKAFVNKEVLKNYPIRVKGKICEKIFSVFFVPNRSKMAGKARCARNELKLKRDMRII